MVKGLLSESLNVYLSKPRDVLSATVLLLFFTGLSVGAVLNIPLITFFVRTVLGIDPTTSLYVLGVAFLTMLIILLFLSGMFACAYIKSLHNVIHGSENGLFKYTELAYSYTTKPFPVMLTLLLITLGIPLSIYVGMQFDRNADPILFGHNAVFYAFIVGGYVITVLLLITVAYALVPISINHISPFYSFSFLADVIHEPFRFAGLMILFVTTSLIPVLNIVLIPLFSLPLLMIGYVEEYERLHPQVKKTVRREVRKVKKHVTKRKTEAKASEKRRTKRIGKGKAKKVRVKKKAEAKHQKIKPSKRKRKSKRKKK